MAINKNIFFFLKLTISFVFLCFFLWKTDLYRILEILLSIPFFSIIFAMSIYFIALFINAFKWRQLMPDYKIKQLFLLTLISQYYSLILPGQMAGEAVKAYKLGKGKQDAERIVASVIIDRITGLIGLMLVAIIGLMCGSNTNPATELMPWLGLILITFSLGLYLFYFNRIEKAVKKILSLITKFFRSAAGIIDRCFDLIDIWKAYLKKPFLLLRSVLLGIIFQVVATIILLIFGKAVGINIAFSDWCWIFGVVSVIVCLPITIGGMGLREGGFVLLLGNLGIPDEKALALSLSIFGLRIFGAAVGGIIDFSMDYEMLRIRVAEKNNRPK